MSGSEVLGKPEKLGLLLYQVLDRARVCSSDPLQIRSVLPLCMPKMSQMVSGRKDVDGGRKYKGYLI